LQAGISQACPARLLTELVVPALDITVGPDGRLECRPTAGWPKPADQPHFVDINDKTIETVVDVAWHGIKL